MCSPMQPFCPSRVTPQCPGHPANAHPVCCMHAHRHTGSNEVGSVTCMPLRSVFAADVVEALYANSAARFSGAICG